MAEKFQRTESLQPLHEIANGLAQEMGEQPQERLDWLMQHNGETFGNLLKQVNSTVRGLNPEGHSFDGEGVQAGTFGGSIPPDQEDKVTLLGELIVTAQQHIVTQTEKGEDAQTIISELAVAIPTVINKLHLFADGNGRTSRMLRMILRNDDQLTLDKIEALVHKNGYKYYDATPVSPIEISVLYHMRKINGTSEITFNDDVVDEDILADEYQKDILQKFPHISPSVVEAYSDTANFSETVRLIAKDEGVDKISLSELFSQITDKPEELAKFTAVYRGVRKQLVEILIGGLTGEAPVPLSVRDKVSDVKSWVNGPRERQGLNPIDPNNLNTIQDFQTAYCETFAPQSTVAAA